MPRKTVYLKEDTDGLRKLQKKPRTHGLHVGAPVFIPGTHNPLGAKLEIDPNHSQILPEYHSSQKWKPQKK